SQIAEAVNVLAPSHGTIVSFVTDGRPRADESTVVCPAPRDAEALNGWAQLVPSLVATEGQRVQRVAAVGPGVADRSYLEIARRLTLRGDLAIECRDGGGVIATMRLARDESGPRYSAAEIVSLDKLAPSLLISVRAHLQYKRLAESYSALGRGVVAEAERFARACATLRIDTTVGMDTPFALVSPAEPSLRIDLRARR